MVAIMELKTKMIKMEAKMETNQLGMKEDLAELLRRGSTTSSPSVISTPLPGHPYRPIPMAYMPRTGQQFSFHDFPYEYQPPPECPSTNSSFNSDQSHSMQEEKDLSSHQNELSSDQNEQPVIDDIITADMVKEARSRSNSRSNFATNLVRQLFDENTRAKSNIAGVCKKEKLDPKKIAAVKRSTLHVYPLAYGESELIAWKKCHLAIDESCRRLNKKK